MEKTSPSNPADFLQNPKKDSDPHDKSDIEIVQSVLNPSEASQSTVTSKRTSSSLAEDQTTAHPPSKQAKRPSYLVDIRGRKNKSSRRLQNASRVQHGEIPQLEELKTVRADDLKDQDWSNGKNESSIRGKESLSRPEDHSDESRASIKEDKKNHHINWLALELKQNEEALLQKIATGKQKQKSSALKYGW